MWSRIPETVPYPVPLGSARNGPPIEQLVCAQRTGRSIAYSPTAMSRPHMKVMAPRVARPASRHAAVNRSERLIRWRYSRL